MVSELDEWGRGGPECRLCGDDGPVVYELDGEATCISCAVGILWAAYHGYHEGDMIAFETIDGP